MKILTPNNTSYNLDKVPELVDDMHVRSKLLNDYSIEIGGGLGPFAGKVWRIGLMGHSAYEKNVDTLKKKYNSILKNYISLKNSFLIKLLNKDKAA